MPLLGFGSGTWPVRVWQSGRMKLVVLVQTCYNASNRLTQLLLSPNSGNLQSNKFGSQFTPNQHLSLLHHYTHAGPQEPLDYHPHPSTTALQDSSHRHLIRRRGRTKTCAQAHFTETQANETRRGSRNIGRKACDEAPTPRIGKSGTTMPRT